MELQKEIVRVSQALNNQGVKYVVVGGGLSTLIETKKGIRPKDREDLLFLMGKKEYLGK